MIKLIIDSTCDLNTEIIEKNNIDMVPLQVIVDGKNLKDKLEIKVEDLYPFLQNGSEIKTSLPLYEDIAPLFRKYAESGQDFIFFSFAKALSGTNNFANILVKELKEEFSTNMAVIDFENGGVASAMIIEKLLIFINDSNPSFNDVIEYSKVLISKMRHVILVNDLTQLRKGGRISTIKSLISGVLSIKPVLCLDKGAIKTYKTAIGLKRTLNELVNYINEHTSNKETEIGILYSANEELLTSTVKLVNKAGFNNIRTGRIASVMTAHIGLDAVSICFFQE